MSTEFTVTVTAVIEGELYQFKRTWPLANEIARKAVGEEIEMVLEEYYKFSQSANLIMRDNTADEE
jgi:hypothetical protein